MKFTTAAILTALLGLTTTQAADAASARRQPNGAIRFYDDNGNDRGYSWCRSRGGWGSMAPPDCSYYTLQQCQASVFGTFSNYCMRNPWAAQATQPRRRR